MSQKRTKVFGHPMHPILTHFPMAMLSITIVWDITGLVTKQDLWWEISFWSMAVGLAIGVLALLTGLMDSVSIPKEGPEERIMTSHMYAMLCATGIYLCELFVRMGHIVPSGSRLILALTLSFIGLITMIIGGWYGGELVYRYHVGRISK